MPSISKRLQSFLDEHAVAYETIHHRRDYTAQEAAAHTHTPGKEFAKTVILWVDGGYAMAVLPAHHMVDLDKLREALGAKEVKLASEDEIRELCPDCEAGAVPPFGNLYNLPVYLSEAMTDDERITFNAGSHEDAIRMMYKDFEKLVQPKVMEFSTRA
jgi:Ala-tRNA(Pro) deacylase